MEGERCAPDREGLSEDKVKAGSVKGNNELRISFKHFVITLRRRTTFKQSKARLLGSKTRHVRAARRLIQRQMGAPMPASQAVLQDPAQHARVRSGEHGERSEERAGRRRLGGCGRRRALDDDVGYSCAHIRTITYECAALWARRA